MSYRDSEIKIPQFYPNQHITNPKYTWVQKKAFGVQKMGWKLFWNMIHG